MQFQSCESTNQLFSVVPLHALIKSCVIGGNSDVIVDPLQQWLGGWGTGWEVQSLQREARSQTPTATIKQDHQEVPGCTSSPGLGWIGHTHGYTPYPLTCAGLDTPMATHPTPPHLCWIGHTHGNTPSPGLDWTHTWLHPPPPPPLTWDGLASPRLHPLPLTWCPHSYTPSPLTWCPHGCTPSPLTWRPHGCTPSPLTWAGLVS